MPWPTRRDGRTCEPYGDVRFKVGMNEGWSESFEKLDSLLADLHQG